MACLWVVVMALATFTVLAIFSWGNNLIESAFEDSELSMDIIKTSKSTTQSLRRASSAASHVIAAMLSPNFVPPTPSYRSSDGGIPTPLPSPQVQYVKDPTSLSSLPLDKGLSLSSLSLSKVHNLLSACRLKFIWNVQMMIFRTFCGSSIA